MPATSSPGSGRRSTSRAGGSARDTGSDSTPTTWRSHPTGGYALVLTSGRAEGDPHRPRPALAVIALGTDSVSHRLAGRLELDDPGADPDRLVLSASGRRIHVGMVSEGPGGDRRPLRPGAAGGRRPIDARSWRPKRPGSTFPGSEPVSPSPQPLESALDLYEAASMRPLGRLPLRGGVQPEPNPADGRCPGGRAWPGGGRHAFGKRPPDRHSSPPRSAGRRCRRVRARSQPEVTWRTSAGGWAPRARHEPNTLRGCNVYRVYSRLDAAHLALHLVDPGEIGMSQSTRRRLPWIAVLSTLLASTLPSLEAFAAAPAGDPEEPQVRGRELFARAWISRDRRSHGGDGLGPVYNERSCLACHDQGGPGGGGGADKNIEIITAKRREFPGRRGILFVRDVVRRRRLPVPVRKQHQARPETGRQILRILPRFTPGSVRRRAWFCIGSGRTPITDPGASEFPVRTGRSSSVHRNGTRRLCLAWA